MIASEDIDMFLRMTVKDNANKISSYLFDLYLRMNYA